MVTLCPSELCCTPRLQSILVPILAWPLYQLAICFAYVPGGAQLLDHAELSGGALHFAAHRPSSG